MAQLTYEKDSTALLVIDPHNLCECDPTAHLEGRCALGTPGISDGPRDPVHRQLPRRKTSRGAVALACRPVLARSRLRNDVAFHRVLASPAAVGPFCVLLAHLLAPGFTHALAY